MSDYQLPGTETMPGRSFQSPVNTERSTEETPESSYDGEDIEVTGLPSEKLQTKRSRTGCWICRSRHLKCDERLPTCGQCAKGGRDCRRGLILKFQHKGNPVVGRITKTARIVKAYPHRQGEWKFEDNSVSIASEYKGGIEQYGFLESQSPPESHSPATSPALGESGLGIASSFPLSSGHISNPTGYTSNIGNVLPNVLPTYSRTPTILATATSGQFDGFQSPMSTSRPVGINQYSATSTYSLPAPESSLSQSPSKSKEIILINGFINEVASWLDTMNSCGFFSHSVPYMALADKTIQLSIFASASYHLNQSTIYGAIKDGVSEQYYQHAQESLRADMCNWKQGESAQQLLVASIVLEYYEISVKTTEDQSKGFERTRTLLKHINKSNQIITDTNTTEGACYWAHTALELLGCLQLQQPFQWDSFQMETLSENHIGNVNIVLNEECKWSRSVIALLIRAKNIVSNTNDQQNAANYAQFRISTTKQDLKNWETRRPVTMKPIAWVEPVYTTNMMDSLRFPQILITNKTSVLAQLMYHTGMIMLSKISSIPTESMADHAKAICGIVKQLDSRILPSFLSPLAAIAMQNLYNREDQDEALQIARKFANDSLEDELLQIWGRVTGPHTRGTSSSTNSVNLAGMSPPLMQANPFTRAPLEPQVGGIHPIQQQFHAMSPQATHRQQPTAMHTPRQRISSFHASDHSNSSSHNMTMPMPMPQIPTSHNLLQPVMQSPTTQHSGAAMSPSTSRPFPQQIMQMPQQGYQMSHSRHVGSSGAGSSHMANIPSPHGRQVLPPTTQYGPY